MRPEPRDNTTTTWGVVLAVGLIAATLALNAPGGSNSIAGRAITATMVTLFPQAAEAPVAATPARRSPAASAKSEPPSAQTPPTPEPAPAAPALAASGQGGAMSEAEIAQGAVYARSYMSHAPAGVEFRNVRPIMTLGLFNADKADTPFLGFCGEIRVPEGEGWGRPGWKPFFISTTASLPARPQGPYLDMANPSTEAKCAYGQTEADYTEVFMSGPTDLPPPWSPIRARSNLPAISPR